MHSRKIIVGALASGPLVGVLLGLAINPAMKPAPEPGWHRIDPDPIFAEPQRIVDAGPQDLSPTWYVDRMPTWKRRAAMREAAMYEEAYGWADSGYQEPQMTAMDERPVVTPVVKVVRGSTAAEVRRGIASLEEAAEAAEVAAHQASAAMADVQPAAVAAYRDDAGDDNPESIVAIELPRQAGT